MTRAFVRTIVLAAGTLAAAGQFTVARAQKSSGVAPLALDSLPPPAPGFEKPEGLKPRDEKDSKLELPTQLNLGNSQLRLDTNRKEIDPIPRIGIDAADPAVLNPNLPQEKASPLKPGYFGFTITTPTH
jgi:hypothetical protein